MHVCVNCVFTCTVMGHAQQWKYGAAVLSSAWQAVLVYCLELLCAQKVSSGRVPKLWVWLHVTMF